MPDREKVIKNLQSVANICALNGDIQSMTAIGDALALLKEQEARVIELSEITPHVYVWVEDRREKTLFPLKGGMVDPDGDDYFRFVENVDADYIYWPTVAYGKWWRVWNLMPSPEQMRDTKWEGEKE